MFAIGSHIVCPGMGVAQVASVESRELSGTSKSFYILKILSNHMKMMVPVENNNLRPLMDMKQISEIFTTLYEQSGELDLSTWNKRHARFHTLLRTGSAQDTAVVYRELMLTKKVKTLSFGERKMLEAAENLLVKEIVYSTERLENNKVPEENVIQNLQACF